MKKDIPENKAKGIKLAIVRKKNDEDKYDWYVCIINENDFPLSNLLVVSKGYGEKNGKKQETSVLRRHIETLEANGNVILEGILPELFHLFNEYWITYYIGREIYDKKFIFAPGSMNEKNISFIKELSLEGVLHL